MGWLGKNNKDESANPWRKRYYTELDQLETELNQIRQTEKALRRLGSRLCVAGKGHCSMLDQRLDDTRTALREPLKNAVVEKLLTELTQTLEQIPQRHEPKSTLLEGSTSGSDSLESGCKILVQIIDNLDLQGEVREQAGKLRARLFNTQTEQQFQARIESLADLLSRQNRQSSERVKHFQALLKRVTQRLDEVTEHLAFDELSRQQGAQNSEALKQHIEGEMVALNNVSKGATDLNSLQRDVDEKIARVDRHLLRFRDRERELAATYRERAERLKNRINQLEEHALSLESEVSQQRKNALTDPLTGIPNRAAWEQAGQDYFAQHRATRQPLCLAIWDIDHFKSINDKHGHQGGDRALQMVARHLQQALPEAAFIARVGGEEFACFLPANNASMARASLERIRLGVEQLSFRHGDDMLKLTVSCGVTEVLPHDTLDSAYARSDTALYEAKRAGRNRVAVHAATTPAA